MISYRFKRRAFLTAMSGGLGLKVMLRNMELSAQTAMKSPGRLLVTHWPVGIVAGSGESLWKPTSGSVGGTGALKAFADAGLASDMTVLRGISTPANLAGGGSHEGGTVVLVTGVGCGGTRTNRTEGDDGYAAGGSFEQILLKNVAALKPPGGGAGYANSIADSRTDFGEVSTKCLSYSTNTQSVTTYSGGQGTENIPLTPVLSPLTQYTNIFQNFVPTSPYDGDPSVQATPPPADDVLTGLSLRKSVLDFALDELKAMQGLVPTDAKNKLQNHYDAVFNMEDQLTRSIDNAYKCGTGGMSGGTGGMMGGTGGMSGGTGGMMGGTGGRAGTGGNTGSGGSMTGTGGTMGGTGGAGGSNGVCGGGCKTKPTQPDNTTGSADPTNGAGNNYGRDGGSKDDAPTLAAAGTAHLEVLKAAFICDILRVGTFQWCPGTNHISFAGKMPNDSGIYQHHPVSHRIGTGDTTVASLGGPAQFLYNCQVWFFEQHAKNFATWKTAVDGCGNPLLDSTVVPFVTEVMATGHERSNMPAMIIGGKALGFQHNQYKTGSISINSYWGTIAQAFGYSGGTPFSSAVSGLWTKPA